MTDDNLPDEMDAAALTLEKAARRNSEPQAVMWSPQGLRRQASVWRAEAAEKAERDGEKAALAQFFRDNSECDSYVLMAELLMDWQAERQARADELELQAQREEAEQ